MESWIEEFLYRGRPPSGPDSDKVPTFHVVLGQQAPDPFDPDGPPARRLTLPMTPEQAVQAHLLLPDLVAGINAQAVIAIGLLEMQLADRDSRIAALETDLAQANADLSNITRTARANAVRAAELRQRLLASLGLDRLPEEPAPPSPDCEAAPEARTDDKA